VNISEQPPSNEGTGGESEASSAKWQDLEARWKAILGLEANIESLRISMEGLVNEMETAFRRTLNIEEKTYALRADVSQWERTKHRVQFALPKMRDFIHRSTWVLGAPERKRLDEVYKEHIQPKIPFPQMDKVLKQLEELQKDRQILAALGKTVHGEAKRIATDIQGAVRTLQSNAASRRIKKGAGSKGGFFK
jgi:uncharacterized protein YoxC